MYLCIGVLLTLMSQKYYGKRNYAYRKTVCAKTFQEFVAKRDFEDRGTVSHLLNCDCVVLKEAREECLDTNEDILIDKLEKHLLNYRKVYLIKIKYRILFPP